jgi:hypothetical protein
VPDHTSPYSRKRIAGIPVSLTLVAVAIYLASDAYRRDREFHQWLVAEPVRVTVDLGQPGIVEAPFSQTCQVAHGEAIYLQFTSDSDVHPATLLEGLRATMEIIAADGRTILTAEVPDDRLTSYVHGRPTEEAGVVLMTFDPFSVGQYSFRLQVLEPAPALAGKPQVLVARYRLCGLEAMPAFFAAVFAAVAGVPGLVIGAVTTVSIRRHGRRVSVP